MSSIDWKAIGWFLGGMFTAERRPGYAMFLFLCGVAAICYDGWVERKASHEQT